MTNPDTITHVNPKDKLTIPERIAEILRHDTEDRDFWKSRPMVLACSAVNTRLARCMTERAWLLRLIGHLEPEKD